MSLARWWMLTVNNPAMSPEDLWTAARAKGCVYLKGQLERGAHGTEHFQLFLSFKEKVRAAHLKKLFPTAHIEQARAEAARAYVWKEETRAGPPFSFGAEPVRVNSKTDWDQVKQLAIAGDFNAIPANILVSHFSNIKAIRKEFMPRAPLMAYVRGVYFYGPARTGKTHAAFNYMPDLPYYLKGQSNKWWDDYRGEPVVIVDDFSMDAAKYCGHLWKNWLDKWPATAEVKGGRVAIAAHTIIFTSNYSLDELFGSDKVGLLEPLIARFRTIRHYSTPGMTGFFQTIKEDLFVLPN